MKKRNKISIAVLLLVLLGAGLLPWLRWTQDFVRQALEKRGFHDVQLTIGSLGLSGATLEKISVGGEHPLTLENVTIHYSLGDLRHGTLRDLALEGLTLEARQSQGKWALSGMDALGDGNGEAFSLPVTSQQLKLPLEKALLKNSMLHVLAEGWNAEIPLELEWEKSPAPKLTYGADHLAFTKEPLSVATGAASAEVALSDEQQKWQGGWSVKNIAVTGAPLPLLEMDASGSLAAQQDKITAEGKAKSAGGEQSLSFLLEYNLSKPDVSRLLLRDILLPWHEGTLRARNVAVPLSDKPISARVEVGRVSLDAVLRLVTSDRATATGTVSGTVPLTVGKGGVFLVHQGKLEADQPGTIMLAPDALPGDNKQLGLVREILGDFHYSRLTLALDSGADNTLAINLTLEGNNPAVYEGRGVKLNVHLGGDVLNLLQQTILPMVDPATLLKQGEQ